MQIGIHNVSDDKLVKEFEEKYRDEIHNYKIDSVDLNEIINKLGTKKACGINKVSNEMIKFGCCGKLLKLISLIFETIINFNVMPSNFNVGLVKLLVKDNAKDHNDINNLRPLTISDTLANIFEKILLKEINKKYKGKSKQFGFRNGSSCIHAVLTLKELILFNRRKKKKTFVGTIDASKAFDKVNRTRLWVKMINLFEWFIVRAIKIYYSFSKVIVCVGDALSSIFNTTIGVKQGGPLSPLLFSIYLDELIDWLENVDIGVMFIDTIINCILFADDILVLADSEEDLNKLLEIVELYGQQNDLKFNHDKTHFIIFGDTLSKTKLESKIKFQGSEIKRVSVIKYLGIFLDERLNEKINLTKRKNSYLIGFNKFKRLGIQDVNVSSEVKLFYYKTYIRPLLYYGIEVMRLSDSQVKKVQTLESNMIK
ncbi:unnamed protein product, partial [Brachionus calyciflorus]